MGSVAVGQRLAVLAHAEVVLGLLGSELDGRVRRSLVCPVAEGLVLGEPAGTIVVFLADLQLDSKIGILSLLGALVCDVWSFHVLLLLLVLRKLV